MTLSEHVFFKELKMSVHVTTEGGGLSSEILDKSMNCTLELAC